MGLFPMRRFYKPHFQRFHPSEAEPFVSRDFRKRVDFSVSRLEAFCNRDFLRSVLVVPRIRLQQVACRENVQVRKKRGLRRSNAGKSRNRIVQFANVHNLISGKNPPGMKISAKSKKSENFGGILSKVYFFYFSARRF